LKEMTPAAFVEPGVGWQGFIFCTAYLYFLRSFSDSLSEHRF
jgi:hypothetical protein